MKDEIAQYDCFLMRRFGSRSTRKHYINDLNLFVKHTGELPVAHIAAKHVDSFVEDQVQRGLKPATINRRFYLFANHLGSVVAVTDSSGQLQGDLILYEPFGDYRDTPPDETNPDISDRGFTNQKHNNDLKLIYYGARYYMPGIGRFLSPDTIVPDPAYPQSLNRYTYGLNNPVKYTDPTGHCVFLPPYDTAACVALLALVVAGESPHFLQQNHNYPMNKSTTDLCDSSLPGCFGDTVLLKDFSGYGEDNPIPLNEFTEFANKVAEDLYTHDLTWPGYYSGRGAYDTPFYNGGQSEKRTDVEGAEEGKWPAEQQVCIDSIGCSGRSEINYIAQGMWGAAVGEPRPISEIIVWTWKGVEYQEMPSPDTLFWLQYGYDYYQNWLQGQE